MQKLSYSFLAFLLSFGTIRAVEPPIAELISKGFDEFEKKDFEKSVQTLTQVLDKDPDRLQVRDRRGDALLLCGQAEKAIADFDIVLKAKPAWAPDHWRRGIALYYAGKYADGVKQFETHKTVNPQDVENAVWHYLCNVHVVGKAKAQAALIDVTQDTRVPMAQIQKLFAGTAKVEDVLAEANKHEEKSAKGIEARCYANLYVGLWYESEGKAESSKTHMKVAAEKYTSDHYMGGIAKMHYAKRNR